MDEARFQAARGAVDALPCVFEKALLAGCAGCELAIRHSLAERETLECRSPVARTNCATLRALLRERSAFPLRLPPAGTALPHAVTMRIDCGGLRGLGESVPHASADVHRLVRTAQERYGSLVDLPWPAIVAAVTAWQGRRRSRPGTAR